MFARSARVLFKSTPSLVLNDSSLVFLTTARIYAELHHVKVGGCAFIHSVLCDDLWLCFKSNSAFTNKFLKMKKIKTSNISYVFSQTTLDIAIDEWVDSEQQKHPKKKTLS